MDQLKISIMFKLSAMINLIFGIVALVQSAGKSVGATCIHAAVAIGGYAPAVVRDGAWRITKSCQTSALSPLVWAIGYADSRPYSVLKLIVMNIDGELAWVPGACYLSLMEDHEMSAAFAKLGWWPTARAVKAWLPRKRRQFSWVTRGFRVAHVNGHSRGSQYDMTRLGGNKRHQRLLLEVRAGLPASSTLCDGRTTADYDVVQPRGCWVQTDDGGLEHQGAFLKPFHAEHTEGYCYLALFQPRYQAAFEAWLGRKPRSRHLNDLANEHRGFLCDRHDYKLCLRIVDKMLVAHITKGDGDLTALQVLDLIPLHKTYVGADGRTRTGAPRGSAANRSLRARGRGGRVAPTGPPPIGNDYMEGAIKNTGVWNLPLELRNELLAGISTNTLLPDGRHTGDFRVIQPHGTWSPGRTEDEWVHTGEYRLALHTPHDPGYCYLFLFEPRYRCVVEAWAGKFPSAAHINDIGTRRPLWTSKKSNLKVVISENEDREWAPTLCHISESFEHFFNGYSLIHTQYLTGRVGGIEIGKQGTSILPDPYEDFDRENRHGFTWRTRGTMYHNGPRSRASRDPHSLNLHALTDDAMEAALHGMCANSPAASLRLRAILTSACAKFDTVVNTYPTGSNVVVAGSNWAVNALSGAHPSHWVEGATHGVMFASIHGEGMVADGWDVIYLPLREDEGRLLAYVRVICTVTGRADIDHVIINERWHRRHPNVFERMVDMGLPYGSWGGDMTPTWLGCHFTQGAIWFRDKKEFIEYGARYGLVYGSDEAFVYRRSPIAVPNTDYNQPFEFMAYGQINEGTTYVRNKPDHTGWSHWAVCLEKWNPEDLIAFYNGESTTSAALIPQSANGPYRTLNWAIEQSRRECEYHDIPFVNHVTRKLLPRRGGRMSKTVMACTDYVGSKIAVPGAFWRPQDVAFGLRSRLMHHMTQGISPEVWDEIKKPTIEPEWDVMGAIKAARVAITKWMKNMEPGTLVTVASVWDQEMLEKFRSAHPKFENWVWLTESQTVRAPEGDILVRLPTTGGTGFIFQLARLIPASCERGDIFMTVVNDLETDFLPRQERLDVGLACMPYYDIVFPAMQLNAPCPFQDVVARCNAISGKRLTSFDRTLSTIGMLYGVDEIWAASHMMPTVGVRWEIGNGALPHFRNPVDAILIRHTGTKLIEHVAPHGNLRKVYGGLTKPKRTINLLNDGGESLGIRDMPVPPEMDLDAWHRYGRYRVLARSTGGEKAIVIFLWGTRGDRVPLRFAGKCLGKLLSVYFVSLCSEEEGRAGLALCETEKSYRLLPDLAMARMSTMDCPVPSLVPAYIGGNGMSWGYSLRPHPDDATKPRGGLPRMIDWLIPLLPDWEQIDIRIGCYRGLTWFPRSADGITAIPSTSGVGREDRKGYVLGSSTIGVPFRYSHWEPILEKDHVKAFQKFTDIACAGGAGVVQTAAAQGARVHAWTNVIDRTYHDPENCGQFVNGNEDPVVYDALAFALYPRIMWKLWRHPRLTLRTLKLITQRTSLWRRMWTMLFVVYSFRQSHIHQTFLYTLVKGATNLTGWQTTVFSLIANRAWVSWGRITGLTKATRGWKVVKFVLLASMSPVVTWLTLYGFSTRKSIVFACIWASFPDPMNIVHRASFDIKRHGRESGIFMGWSFVYHLGIPVGLHAILYDTDSGKLIQGVHSGRPGLYTPFHRADTYTTAVDCLIWFKTDLTPGDIKTTATVTRKYSAFYNCQTIVARLILQRPGAMASGIGFLVLFGTGTAFMGIVLASVIAVTAGTLSLTALAAIAPIFGRDHAVTAVVSALADAVTGLAPQFGIAF